MKVTINSKEYEIDLDKALKLGIIKPVALHFNDILAGDLFLYEDMGDKGLFIKSGPFEASRIAGTGAFKTNLGKIDRLCGFRSNPEVKVFRNGDWTSKL